MGHKLVCFTCRVARNLSLDITTWESTNKFCIKCLSEMKILSHRFRPPNKDDVKKWDVVFYLFENGFRYEHIYDDNTKSYAKIPENMRESVEFINTYKFTI